MSQGENNVTTNKEITGWIGENTYRFDPKKNYIVVSGHPVEINKHFIKLANSVLKRGWDEALEEYHSANRADHLSAMSGGCDYGSRTPPVVFYAPSRWENLIRTVHENADMVIKEWKKKNMYGPYLK